MSRKLSSTLHQVLVRSVLVALIAAASPALLVAQPPNPPSPRTSAATQIGDHWIKVDYSAPVLRGRQGIFGSGDSYGQTLKAGAPVWRAGADSSTRFKTDVALEINGTKVPAGEYSFLIDLKADGWTAILSGQPYIGRVNSPEEVREGMAEGKAWGGYGYKMDADAARAPMTVRKIEASIDNLTYWFMDVSEEGGTLAIAWDDHEGFLSFKIAE